jgi:hypothetical protein
LLQNERITFSVNFYFTFKHMLCAPEVTIIDVYNNSKEELILLSRTEVEDYKTAFLAKEIIEERTIRRIQPINILGCILLICLTFCKTIKDLCFIF